MAKKVGKRRKIEDPEERARIRAMKNRQSAQASRSRQKEYIAKLEEGNKEMAERLEIVEKQNKDLTEKLEYLMASLQQPQLSFPQEPAPLLIDTQARPINSPQQPSSSSSSQQPESFFDQLFPNAKPVQDVTITASQQAEFESLFDFSTPTYPNLSFQPSLNPLQQEHKTGPTVTSTLQQLNSLMFQNLAARDLNLYGNPTISSIRCTQIKYSKQVEMLSGKEGQCGNLGVSKFKNSFPICAEILAFVNKK